MRDRSLYVDMHVTWALACLYIRHRKNNQRKIITRKTKTVKSKSQSGSQKEDGYV